MDSFSAIVTRMTKLEAESHRFDALPRQVQNNEIRTLVTEAVARTQEESRDATRKALNTAIAVAAVVSSIVATSAAIFMGVWPTG